MSRDERQRQAVAATRAGRTAPDIAAALGVSVRSVERYRAAAGLCGPASTPLTPDELATAADLLADGCSYAEVARTLGRTYRAIARHLPGYTWSPKQRAAHALACRYLERRMLA